MLSTEPGRPDYMPAWTLYRVRWTGSPRLLASVAEVEAARAAGALTVDRTTIVLNAEVVKWSTGEMAVDRERTACGAPHVLIA